MAGPYAPSDSRSYVGFGKQVSRGTGVVPTLWIPYMEAVDLDHAQAINRIMEAGAAGMVTQAEKTSEISVGAFTFLARPSTTSKLAAFLLGVDTVTGVGPWVHTIVDDFVTDYMSAEQNLADDLPERFVDAAIAELVFTCDVASPKLRVRGAWVGGKPAVVAATAESYETDNPFVISDGVFTVDGSAATNVRRFSLTLRARLAPEQVADVVADYVVKVGFEVELELEQFVLDIATEYRRTHYGSPTGTAYQKTPSTGAFIANFNYGAGAAARQLKLTVANLDYDDAKYTALNPGANEGVKVVRGAAGRKAAGASLLEYVGTTNDSAAYV